MQDVFKGLKVLELASVLAGPAVGMFFAELGAEVTKIENGQTGGDLTRQWKLPSEPKDSPISAYYASVNYGKSSLMLDLNSPEGKQQVLALLAETDIVVANYLPSVAQRFGLSYEAVSAINPKIIYANLTGFGPDNPRLAFDVILQAESGFLYMNGEPDRTPVKMPVALIDILAAHQLKEGILLALWQRERTGKGAYIETSLLKSAIASLANQATNWLMQGHVPQRMGTLHPNIAPYGDVFRSADNQSIITAVGTDQQFQGLCNLLDVPQLAQHGLFHSNVLRVKNRADLNQVLSQAFGQLEAAVIMERSVAHKVPLGVIKDLQAVFDEPTAQSMILEDTIEGRACRRVSSVAFTIS